MSKLRIYAPSVLVPVLLGAAVGLLTMGSMDYETLRQPPLSPPGWLFPVVWTILYVLMGVSYGMIKETKQLESGDSLIYYIQLGVNLLWPIAFFLLKWRLFAFFWIILLDVLVLLMLFRFKSKVKTAGLLQIPYAVWVLFATYLNLGVYLLNG
ncbi:MAG: tryptophan-rich sensory protein [Ruminococcus sp.]|nr:tryptophan-rich sensory protein [Ruminococcus sp.]